MTTQMWGADADALDTLARSFGDASEHLRRIQRGVRAGVHTAPWRGHRADVFRGEWDGRHTRALLGAAEAVSQAADLLRRNADEQRRASSAGGGSLAALPGGAGGAGGHGGPLGLSKAWHVIKTVKDWGSEVVKLKGLPGMVGRLDALLWAGGRAATWKTLVGLPGSLGVRALEEFLTAHADLRTTMDAFIHPPLSEFKAGAVTRLFGESSIGAATTFLGRASLGGVVLSGAIDAITGGGDSGFHGALTRGFGAAGAIGAGALLGVSFGIIGGAAAAAVAPVAAVAVTAYGIYSAGNFVVHHWDGISRAVSTGWHAAGSAVSAASDAVGAAASHAVDSVANAAKDTLRTITHPTSVLKAIHVF